MTAIPTIPSRKPRRQKPGPAQDAIALGEVITAMVAGMGRGGLTWLSDRLQMTPSAMLKRLNRPAAGFEAVTMRGVLLLQQRRADRHQGEPVMDTQEVGGYVIELRPSGPTWRPSEEKPLNLSQE